MHPDRLEPAPSRDHFYGIFALLCTAAVTRLWILPMGNSLWLDETLIVWTISDGVGAIVPRAFISLQSIAFCMVEWLISTISTSEIVLRLPSLLAAFGTVYLYYRIGVDAVDHELGLFLAALFIAWPAVAVEVPNARPYALALFFHTAALYWLLAWLRSARSKHGVLWIGCAAAATHFHHLFVSAIPLETAFLMWAVTAHKTQVSRVHLAACTGLGVLLLLPALPQALVFLNQSQLLSLGPPSWFALLSAIVPLAMLPAPMLLLLLEWIAGRRPSWSAARPGKELVLLAGLLLTIPVAFFALSRLTSTRVFETRYLLPSLPGLVILSGWVLRGFETSARRVAMLGVLVHSIVFVGGPSIVPDYRGEDWRGAVSALPNSGVIVLYPGLVETRNLSWLQVPERWAYMTAPVSAYRPGLSRADTFVLPFEMGLEDRAYADGLVTDRLRSERSITLIVRGRLYGPAWARWFTNRLARQACRKAREYLLQGMEVHIFSCQGGH